MIVRSVSLRSVIVRSVIVRFVVLRSVSFHKRHYQCKCTGAEDGASLCKHCKCGSVRWLSQDLFLSAP